MSSILVEYRKMLALLAVAILLGIVGAPGVTVAESGKQQSPVVGSPLPEAKQTTLALYVTSAEAYDKWKQNPAKVKVLDVRTIEEFIFIGHAEMAWNIPLVVQTDEWDASKAHFAMKPTTDFADRAKSVFAMDDTLLVMCRSGGRSAMAVNELAKAGFNNVYNITDGMEGDMVHEPGSVFHGKRMKNGWKNSGMPWTYEIDPKRVVLPKSR